MLRIGVFVALLAACHDVQASRATSASASTLSPATSSTASGSVTASTVSASSASASPPATSSTTTTAFFATPPASLSVPADFTAGPFFATDFLQRFFPGFGPTQTSVEPQPLITDPVVSILD